VAIFIFIKIIQTNEIMIERLERVFWHEKAFMTSSNLESAHMKFQLTKWLMRIVCYLSYETCGRFWSGSVCWNSFQH